MPELDDVINLKLLSHPINWLLVWIVLMFGGLAFAFLHKSVNPPSTPSKS